MSDFVRSSLVSLCLFSCLSGRRWYLKYQKLAWTSLQFRTVCHGILPSRSVNKAQDCFPEVQGWGAALCFFFLPLRISNLASVTMRQLSLSSSFHIPDQLFLVSKYEVQWRVPPLLGSSVTCTGSVRLLPVVWRQPCVLPLDKAVYRRHPLERHLCVCPLSNARTPDWPIVHPQVELCAFHINALSHKEQLSLLTSQVWENKLDSKWWRAG